MVVKAEGKVRLDEGGVRGRLPPLVKALEVEYTMTGTAMGGSVFMQLQPGLIQTMETFFS